MQCMSASSVEATWEQKSVTVILLNPVLMPELFSVLGEPLNCQCSFSHLPLLSPATLLHLSIVGCVLCVCVITYLHPFSFSSFFLLFFLPFHFATVLSYFSTQCSQPNLLHTDSSLNVFHFACTFSFFHRQSSVMCLSSEASLSCACIMTDFYTQDTTNEVLKCYLSLSCYLSFLKTTLIVHTTCYIL